MAEENSNLLALRPANSPNGFDLRRIGAHPDYWYPLAWSDELKTGRTLGRRFAGEPIVLYRGKSGRVFALEDRCAHRQVPLRFGVVAGETLRCCYHGWTYDGGGRCVDVPYLGSNHSQPNGVRSYPCREQAGLIFVFPGTAERAAWQRAVEIQASVLFRGAQRPPRALKGMTSGRPPGG